MTAKYIIVEKLDGFEYPYLFSPLINHDDFAIQVRGSGKVVAAGFVSFNDGCSCFGKSTSLEVSSRAADNEVLKTMFQKI